MSSLRISVTELDSYRAWLDPDNEDWFTSAKFLDRLRGKDDIGRAAMAGTAFHHVLENAKLGPMPERFSVIMLKGDDGRFNPATDGTSLIDTDEWEQFDFHIDIDADLELPDIKEIKTEKKFLVDGMEVILVGKADGLTGKRIVDYKLTGDGDLERFLDMMQWRCYLSLFEADEFEYRVFLASELKDQTWKIRNYDTLVCHRYPGLDEDVRRSVAELARFIRDRVPERLNRPEDAEKALVI